MTGFLKKARTLLAFVITLTILISTVSIAEVHAGHWADAQMNKWNAQGMLKGDANGDFRPNDSITRAEFMALINRMQGYSAKSEKVGEYKDVKAEDWYYDTVAVALEAGYINGVSADMMEPNGLITREQAMAILSRISGAKKDSSAYMKANDSAMVSEWAKEGVSTCIAQGFITGSNGNLNPLANITRAEAVVMLDRKLTDTRMFGFAGEYDLANQEVKNLEVLSDKITVKNATVKENLVIKDTVGDGDVHLDAVNVEGNLYANGGGEHSLYFNSVRVDGSLIVHKYDGKIRIVASGSTKTKMTVLESGAILVNQSKDGKTFEEVLIKTEDSSTEIELVGDFNKVENSSKDVELKLDGKVEKLTLNEDTKISGEAEVKKLESGKDVEVKVETKDGKVQTLKSDTASLTVKGDKLTESDKPAKSDSEDSLGGSLGGGSTGGSTGSDPSNGTSTTTGSGTAVDPNAGGSGSGNGTGSGAGSGTGSGSGSGTTSGAGTVIDPSTGTTAGLSGYIDPRFADGYPKLSLDSNGKMQIKVKLKEAPAKPIHLFAMELYRYDDKDKTTALAITLGSTEEKTGNARVTYFIELNDNNEHIINTNSILSNNLTAIGLVLKEADGSLGEVNKIVVESKISNELDYRRPYLSTYSYDTGEKAIFINKAKNEIYIYYNERLDVNSVPDKSAFTLSEGQVDAVSIINDDKHNHYGVVKLSLSGVNSINGLKLTYTVPSTSVIQDKATPVPNKADSFVGEKVTAIEAAIKEVFVGHSLKKFQFMIYGIGWRDVPDKNNDVETELNGTKLNRDHTNLWENKTFLRYNLSSPVNKGNIKIKLTPPSGEKVYDIAGNEYDELIFSENATNVRYLPKLEFEKELPYNNGEIILENKVNSIINQSCTDLPCFAIKIDGKLYRLQANNARREWNNNALIKFRTRKDRFDYYTDYIVPKIDAAFADGKEVKLIYDTNYILERDLIRGGISDKASEPYLPFGEKKEWKVVKK